MDKPSGFERYATLSIWVLSDDTPYHEIRTRLFGCTRPDFITALWNIDPFINEWESFGEQIVFCAVNYIKPKADKLRSSQKDYQDKLNQASVHIDEVIKIFNLLDKLSLFDNAGSNYVDTSSIHWLNNTVQNQANPMLKTIFNNLASDFVADAMALHDTGLKRCFPNVLEMLQELSDQLKKGVRLNDVIEVSKRSNKYYDFLDHFFNMVQGGMDNGTYSTKLLKPGLICLMLC